METTERIALNNFLKQFIAEKRLQRFEEVLNNRIGHLHIVLENIFQAHNAAAVVRSCDGFGIQHVHFIENKNHLKISDEVAMGSSQWMTLHRYNDAENNSLKALRSLKQQGFKIVATSPHQNQFSLDTLPIDQKIALVFGTEKLGISQDVYNEADAFVALPMLGFTESFNISVCAALCMYELSRRIRKEVQHPFLAQEEKEEVMHKWLCASVDNSEALLKRFADDEKRRGNSIGL